MRPPVRDWSQGQARCRGAGPCIEGACYEITRYEPRSLGRSGSAAPIAPASCSRCWMRRRRWIRNSLPWLRARSTRRLLNGFAAPCEASSPFQGSRFTILIPVFRPICRPKSASFSSGLAGASHDAISFHKPQITSTSAGCLPATSACAWPLERVEPAQQPAQHQPAVSIASRRSNAERYAG